MRQPVIFSLFLVATALSACANDPIPFFFGEGPDDLQCTDGIDNDSDGAVDCADDGCALAGACGGIEADTSDTADIGDTAHGGDTAEDTDVGPPDATDAADDAVDQGSPDAVDAAEPDVPEPPQTFDRSDPVDVCDRWTLDRGDLREGAWSGDVETCNAGELESVGRENTLRQVNLLRWLAGLNDDIDTSDDRDASAQECALMSHANDALNHGPPPSWTCYSSDGAGAAGMSNLSPTPAVEAIGLYMDDPGNSTTLGHRRWILSDSLGPIGIGSTDRYSCLHVISGSGTQRSEWTAWPAPGPFPIGAMRMSWSSVDENGWSIQSDTIGLGSAEVTVLEDGVERPVRVTNLEAGYGSTSAISFAPDGWQSRAGSTYTVQVDRVASPFSYEVAMLDCD